MKTPERKTATAAVKRPLKNHKNIYIYISFKHKSKNQIKGGQWRKIECSEESTQRLYQIKGQKKESTSNPALNKNGVKDSKGKTLFRSMKNKRHKINTRKHFEKSKTKDSFL